MEVEFECLLKENTKPQNISRTAGKWKVAGCVYLSSTLPFLHLNVDFGALSPPICVRFYALRLRMFVIDSGGLISGGVPTDL